MAFVVVTGSAKQVSRSQPASAQVIVHTALQHDFRNLNLMRNYVWKEKRTETIYKKGRPRKTTSMISEHMLVDGKPFVTVLRKNGKDVKSSQKRKDDWIKGAELLRSDIERNFIFSLDGKALCNGRLCWKVNAEPKPKKEFKTQSEFGPLLPYIHGTIWIDTKTLRWLCIDASVVKDANFFFSLLSLDKGSTFHIFERKVDKGVWYPYMIRRHIKKRMFEKFEHTVLIQNYDFRRFKTSSTIVAYEDN